MINKPGRNRFDLISDKRKNEFLIHLKSFETFFKEKFNLPIYLIYGTLLGIIREGDFIEKDKDIDVSYLSKYHTKEEVKKEIAQLNDALISFNLMDNNFGGTGQWHVKDKPTGTYLFDVWTSWIDENNNYCSVPLGPTCPAENILPFVRGKLRTDYFYIPKNSEKLIDQIYTSWKTPMDMETKFIKSETIRMRKEYRNYFIE